MHPTIEERYEHHRRGGGLLDFDAFVAGTASRSAKRHAKKEQRATRRAEGFVKNPCEWCNEKRAVAHLFCNGCGRNLCNGCSRDDPSCDVEDNEPFGGSICPGCDDEIEAEHAARAEESGQ